MDHTPLDPPTLRDLQMLSADFADALKAERRCRRRLDAAIRDGRDSVTREAQLDGALDRVADLLDEIARIAQSLGPRAIPSVGAVPASGTRPRAGTMRDPLGGARQGPIGAPLVASAVDIGSNSVHLLVAVVAGHRLEPLLDISEFLGLGAAVDDRGELGPELRARLVQTLTDYANRARTLGSAQIVLVGTDPLRRAADAAQTIAEVEAATGARVSVVSHDEEAYLTLLGVTAGRPVRRDLVLVDIGGGSSEVLHVPPAGDPVAVGLPMGSARLTRRLVAHDPPTRDEIEALLAEARQIAQAAPAAQPVEVIVVGGSATNLLRVVPAAALDRRLTVGRVAEALAILSQETAAQAATHHGMREPRARMMAAGAAIVMALIERYGVERVRVESAGIREGLVLAAAHAGSAWREQLVWLAHGWSR